VHQLRELEVQLNKRHQSRGACMNHRGRVISATLLIAIGITLLFGNMALAEGGDRPLFSAERGPIKISAKSLNGGGAGGGGILLEGKAGMSVTPLVEVVENPARVVIDLPGILIRKQGATIPVRSPVLSSVRFGIHPEKTRIVLDVPSVPTEIQSEPTVDGFSITMRVARTDALPAIPAPSVSPQQTPMQAAAQLPELLNALPEPIRGPDLISVRRAPVAPVLIPSAAMASLVTEQPQQKPVSEVSPATTVKEDPDAVESSNGELQGALPSLWAEEELIQIAAASPPVRDLKVTNLHSAPVLAMVQALEVGGEGASAQEVIVTPKRFRLEGGESRLLRIVSRAAPASKDRRFEVTTVSGPTEGDLFPTADSGRAVRIATILIEPRSLSRRLSWSRKAGQKLRLQNEGNTLVQIVSAQQLTGVDGQQPLEITALKDQRIFAGEELELDLLAPRGIRLLYRGEGGIEQLQIPPD
jgi:hypothetical protein